VLASCGAAVRPELPLSPAEEALVAGIDGDWFGMRTYIDISPNPLPGGDVRYAYAHARITRITSRSYEFQWVSYLENDVARRPRYRIALSDGQLLFDRDQVIVETGSGVAMHFSDRSGSVSHQLGTLTVDFVETLHQQNLTTTSRHHYRLVATRNRP
jgi:hypothetical protein